LEMLQTATDLKHSGAIQFLVLNLLCDAPRHHIVHCVRIVIYSQVFGFIFRDWVTSLGSPIRMTVSYSEDFRISPPISRYYFEIFEQRAKTCGREPVVISVISRVMYRIDED